MKTFAEKIQWVTEQRALGLSDEEIEIKFETEIITKNPQNENN